MRLTRIRQVYFSPTGTTGTIVAEIAKAFEGEKDAVDLLRHPLRDDATMGSDELLIAGMPVFAGRVPPNCGELLARLKGDGTPAIAVVAYGNRDYDDALLELRDILEENGFIVIGAAAFIAQHSIFPAVAAGRPDAADIARIRDFAARCVRKLDEPAPSGKGSLAIKGNKPYKKAKTVPLKPAADSRCTKCGVCVAVCPTGAIPADAPDRTDKGKCISCAACIAACPVKARRFGGFLYRVVGKLFKRKCAVRREPEVFV